MGKKPCKVLDFSETHDIMKTIHHHPSSYIYVCIDDICRSGVHHHPSS